MCRIAVLTTCMMLLVGFCETAAEAAEVYRCQRATGVVELQDSPCDGRPAPRRHSGSSGDPLRDLADVIAQPAVDVIGERAKRARLRHQPQIGNTIIQRPVRDCMKYGNVIDDDALRCIRGE